MQKKRAGAVTVHTLRKTFVNQGYFRYGVSNTFGTNSRGRSISKRELRTREWRSFLLPSVSWSRTRCVFWAPNVSTLARLCCCPREYRGGWERWSIFLCFSVEPIWFWKEEWGREHDFPLCGWKSFEIFFWGTGICCFQEIAWYFCIVLRIEGMFFRTALFSPFRFRCSPPHLVASSVDEPSTIGVRRRSSCTLHSRLKCRPFLCQYPLCFLSPCFCREQRPCRCCLFPRSPKRISGLKDKYGAWNYSIKYKISSISNVFILG